QQGVGHLVPAACDVLLRRPRGGRDGPDRLGIREGLDGRADRPSGVVLPQSSGLRRRQGAGEGRVLAVRLPQHAQGVAVVVAALVAGDDQQVVDEGAAGLGDALQQQPDGGGGQVCGGQRSRVAVGNGGLQLGGLAHLVPRPVGAQGQG